MLDVIVVCVARFFSFPSAIILSDLCSGQIMNIYAWRNSVASVFCRSPSNSATVIPNFSWSRLCCWCSETENTKILFNINFIIYGMNKTEHNLYFPNLYIFSNLRVMQDTTCWYKGQGLWSFADAYNSGTSAQYVKGAVSSSSKLAFYTVLQNEFPLPVPKKITPVS